MSSRQEDWPEGATTGLTGEPLAWDLAPWRSLDDRLAQLKAEYVYHNRTLAWLEDELDAVLLSDQAGVVR